MQAIDIEIDKDLIIRRQQLEIERLRIELAAHCKPIEWLSPLEISKISNYSAYQIRRIIDRSVDDPNSRLVNRVHYQRREVCGTYRYKVNWEAVKELI